MSTGESDEGGVHSSPHSSGSLSRSLTSYGATQYQAMPASPNTTRLRQEEDKRMSLEERHQQLNTLFGIKPFKSHISRRRAGERSPALQELYEDNKTFGTSLPGKQPKETTFSILADFSLGTGIGNFVWVFLFGWILYVVYAIAAVLLYITYVGRPYSSICEFPTLQ